MTPPAPYSEAWYEERLAQKLHGKTQVNTPVGRIDIVTPTEIIELKKAKDWKSALGQIKCYGDFYPNHKMRIHLFGEMTQTQLNHAKSICKKENIKLTWET